MSLAFQKGLMARYRLSPADLARTRHPLQTEITSATVVGLEEVAVLLYLRGFTKPLAISDAQCQLLTHWTGTSDIHQWVGYVMELQVELIEGRPTIGIRFSGKDEKKQRSRALSWRKTSLAIPSQERTSNMGVITMFLVLLLALVLVFLLDNSEAFWQVIERLTE